jgi:hypothetical protein
VLEVRIKHLAALFELPDQRPRLYFAIALCHRRRFSPG